MSILATKLRTLISQDRIRHEELSLNIDLTYITNRVLAMSFPASGIEAAWRNDIADVCRLLRAKHKNNFLVWNLSEREYEYDLLDNQIVCVPFKDHHAPPLHIIFQIIQHIDSWLRANPQHVAIVHCIGGKGRTGLVTVCYLYFSGLFTDINKCLTYFALRRSATGKGVTQPSQLRYVHYFSDVVSGKKGIPANTLTLKKIVVGPVPKGVYVYVEIYQQHFAEGSSSKVPAERIILSTFKTNNDAKYIDARTLLSSDCDVDLSGDILLRGHYIEGKSKPKPLFRMQFYVGLLESNEVVVPRAQLDDMHKEKKRFASDFHLRLIFDPTPPEDGPGNANDDAIFSLLRNSYKDMLASRVKALSDAEIENAPARQVGWQNGNYVNSLVQTLGPNSNNIRLSDYPSGSPRNSERYRESMLQTKPTPARTPQQPPQELEGQSSDQDVSDQEASQLNPTESPETQPEEVPEQYEEEQPQLQPQVTQQLLQTTSELLQPPLDPDIEIARRQRYLNQHLDYLETQLKQLELVVASRLGTTTTTSNSNSNTNTTPAIPANNNITTTAVTDNPDITTPTSVNDNSDITTHNSVVNDNNNTDINNQNITTTKDTPTPTKSINNIINNIVNNIINSNSTKSRSNSNPAAIPSTPDTPTTPTAPAPDVTITAASPPTSSPSIVPYPTPPISRALTSPTLIKSASSSSVGSEKDTEDSFDSGNNSSDDTASFDNALSDTASGYGSDTNAMERDKRTRHFTADVSLYNSSPSILSPASSPPSPPYSPSLSSTATHNTAPRLQPTQPMTIPKSKNKKNQFSGKYASVQ